jgi:hypothetical protein
LDLTKNVLPPVKPKILKFSASIRKCCKSLQQQLKLGYARSGAVHMVLWSLQHLTNGATKFLASTVLNGIANLQHQLVKL